MRLGFILQFLQILPWGPRQKNVYSSEVSLRRYSRNPTPLFFGSFDVLAQVAISKKRMKTCLEAISQPFRAEIHCGGIFVQAERMGCRKYAWLSANLIIQQPPDNKKFLNKNMKLNV